VGHADQELNGQQGTDHHHQRRDLAAGHHAGDGDQHAPGDGDQGQRQTRPAAITPVTARELEQRIAQRKCRHDPAPLDLGQLQVGHHRRPGDRQVAAQQVGHEADENHHAENAPAYVGGPGGEACGAGGRRAHGRRLLVRWEKTQPVSSASCNIGAHSGAERGARTSALACIVVSRAPGEQLSAPGSLIQRHDRALRATCSRRSSATSAFDRHEAKL